MPETTPNERAWKIINDATCAEDDGTKGTHTVIGFEHLHESIIALLDELAESNSRLAVFALMASAYEGKTDMHTVAKVGNQSLHVGSLRSAEAFLSSDKEGPDR